MCDFEQSVEFGRGLEGFDASHRRLWHTAKLGKIALGKTECSALPDYGCNEGRYFLNGFHFLTAGIIDAFNMIFIIVPGPQYLSSSFLAR